MANMEYTLRRRVAEMDDRVVVNVKRLRVAAEYTQLGLAVAMGCHRDLIRMLEQGRRKLKLSEAVIMCGLLDCPIGDLVQFDGEQLALPDNEEAA